MNTPPPLKVASGILTVGALVVLGSLAVQRGSWEPALRAVFIAVAMATVLSFAGFRPFSWQRFSFLFSLALSIVASMQFFNRPENAPHGHTAPFSLGTSIAILLVALIASTLALRWLANRPGPPSGNRP